MIFQRGNAAKILIILVHALLSLPLYASWLPPHSEATPFHGRIQLLWDAWLLFW